MDYEGDGTNYSRSLLQETPTPQTKVIDGHDGSPSPKRVPTKHSSNRLPIIFYSCVVFLPLVCFSVVILGLVFSRKVGSSKSAANEIPGGFYLVNFPAARLIFIASWSSSIAPRLITVAMGLYLFYSAKSLLALSAQEAAPGLPTPHQLVLLLNMSTGGITQLWGYFKHWARSKNKISSLVNSMAFYLVVLQVITIVIFALDSLLHFTTESVSFPQKSPQPSVQHSFSQGLSSICFQEKPTANIFDQPPCTYESAATGEGLVDLPEMVATLNDISSQHKLLNTTTTVDDGSETDLVILGPASESVPGDLEYRASTVGVATSCKPISRLCHLEVDDGASTPFKCSSQFWGDVQAMQVQTNASSWRSPSGSTQDDAYWFGANFLDSNLTKPYVFRSSSIKSSQIPQTWYLGIAIRTGYGTAESSLKQDPDIIFPLHGGMAYIFGCQISAYIVDYTFYNGSIETFSASKANSTISWLFNDIVVYPSLSYFQEQGVSTSMTATSSKGIARAWAMSYSQLAVSIMATVHEPRPNLDETTVSDMIVTKVPKGALFALVFFNLLFALVGLWLGIIAFTSTSSKVSAVQGGLSVEGLVAQLFEPGGGMVAGVKTRDCFDENVGGPKGKIGLREIQEGQWILEKKFQ